MTNKDVVFSIPAVIDDQTPLPQYQGFHRQKFVLDLRELKLMNSVGIRNWVHWIQSFKEKNEIILINCPVIFLNIAAIVVDVVPPEVRIESMVLRYIENDSNEVMRCLLTRPKTDLWEVPQILLFQESGSPLEYEFDGILSKSLGRLKGEVKIIDQLDSSEMALKGIQILTKE